jgi:hypothetical protein
LHATFGDRTEFLDVLIRQAHPGPRARPYTTPGEKRRDAERFQRAERIPYPVLVDDVAGTTHQVYGGLADPTYLIGRDGRVAFYCMWTHGPTLHEALTDLLAHGGTGVVRGGIDRTPHLLASLAAGWRGLRRGLPQSFTDLELAAPGMASAVWLGDKLRPVLAPVALRSQPLPPLTKLGLALGAGVVLGLFSGRREQVAGTG